MDHVKVDEQALKISKEYKKCEAELLEIIIKIDETKIYQSFGYPSLFQYVVNRLKLSEAQAYNFINVGRKAKDVPKLKESIAKGELTVSKAKKITSVITPDNQDHWLKLAQTAPQKRVEREVALAHPQKSIPERMTYVSSLKHERSEKDEQDTNKVELRVKMQLGISEELMLKIKRVQDLISQKKRASVGLENTLDVLVSEYIKRHDPVEKAKRCHARTESKSTQLPREVKILEANHVNKKISETLKNKLSSTQKTDSSPAEQVLRTVAMPQSSRIKRRDNHKSSLRAPLAAALKHQVYSRDNGQCTATDDKGHQCESRRFVDIHHIRPLSLGGRDELANLTLLCSGHHSAIHSR